MGLFALYPTNSSGVAVPVAPVTLAEFLINDVPVLPFGAPIAVQLVLPGTTILYRLPTMNPSLVMPDQLTPSIPFAPAPTRLPYASSSPLESFLINFALYTIDGA